MKIGIPLALALLVLVTVACDRPHDGGLPPDSSVVSEPLVAPPSIEIAPGDHPSVREVKLLAQARRFDESRALLAEYRVLHPEDPQGPKLDLFLRILEKESRVLGLLAEQGSPADRILADLDYQRARQIAERPVMLRLQKAEQMVVQGHYPEAVSICNGILQDFPLDEATLTFKLNLLDYLTTREKDKITREKDQREREVITEIDASSIMPREQQQHSRPIIIFEDDLEEQARQRVLDKLRIMIPSINYKAAPIANVLKEIFAIAGINYVIEDAALGSKLLDIYLIDVSLEQLLEAIVRIESIHFNYRGNLVYVTSAASDVLMTEIIRLQAGLTDTQRELQLGQVNNSSSGGGGGTTDIFANNTGNSDLERLVAELPTLIPDWPPGSKTFYEPKSHSLYIKSSPSAIAETKRLIHAMDYNSAMVLIEAKFVEVNDNAERELGVDWKIGAFKTSGSEGVMAGGAQSGATASGSLFADLAAFANPALAFEAARGAEAAIAAANAQHGGLTLGLIGAGLGMSPNFEVQLNALEERGMANTLSEPKILTISNATGMIDISRDFVYREEIEVENINVNVNNYNGGGNTTVPDNRVIRPKIGTDYEGINFIVKPSVARNSDTITLHVVPTVRFALEKVTFPLRTADGGDVGEIERYRFETRRLATTLHVKSGQTVVMGGLITAQDMQSRSGIPYLMDVPLLGAAFRKDSMSMKRSKLLIFLTVYLIDPDGAKYNEEVHYLRDMAKVVLPPSIHRAIGEQEAASALAAEQDRREQRAKAAEAFKPDETAPAIDDAPAPGAGLPTRGE